MRQLTQHQQEKLAAELNHIQAVWWVFPSWVLVVGTTVSIVALFYWDGMMARVISAASLAFCVSQIAYRAGIHNGFAEGYVTRNDE